MHDSPEPEARALWVIAIPGCSAVFIQSCRMRLRSVDSGVRHNGFKSLICHLLPVTLCLSFLICKLEIIVEIALQYG